MVTVTGHDNTYSAGKLWLRFYSTTGVVMSQGAIIAAQTQPFKQYFFKNSYGGAFQLQANFRVTGGVTTVGSVDLTITNTVGDFGDPARDVQLALSRLRIG